MNTNRKDEKTNIRYNIIKIFVYIVGIVLIAQLFQLQVINGQEYREQSNTRLTRESTLEAARGYIKDRNGSILAGIKMGFNLQLYRTKVSTETLNNTLLNIVQVLEKHEDKYIDNFPIQVEPFSHNFSTEEEFTEWKKENDIEEQKSPEECFYIFKEEYEIQQEDIKEVRKIIGLRYEITQNGYSAIRPLLIAKDISRESAIELSEQGEEVSGLNIVVQPTRDYINGSLASHVIGYIGSVTREDLLEYGDEYGSNDYIGRSGIEYLFEEYLRGENGIKQIDMDIDGNITDEYIYQEAVAGSDVVLTIDANLQTVAEQALKDNIEKIKSGGFSKTYDAKSGAVVVMNAKTGEVLALANYPDYEPELFVKGISQSKWNEYVETNAIYNRAVQGSYAPGSIFKMITAIAGLETGAIERQEKILTKGKYPLAHKPVCWVYTDYGKTHGLINVSEAIKYSCNYFFYEVGNRMGIDAVEKYAKYFGLGSKTGIELPGEAQGTLATKENLEKTGETWNLGNTLSAVIGQGQNSFSPLQIAKYISILVNGGEQITPTIIKTIVRADGTEVSREEINEFVDNKLGTRENTTEKLDISQENIDAVLKGMESVTGESDGTAYGSFANFKIDVGGKTGSAEAGEYTNGWFAGFAPYDDPEIAVVVMVENANKGSYTAEVARKIMDEYFGMNVEKIDEDLTAIPLTEQ